MEKEFIVQYRINKNIIKVFISKNPTKFTYDNQNNKYEINKVKINNYKIMNLWHRRLGHFDISKIKRQIKQHQH